MAHVFISYGRPDEPFAERVALALRSSGYQVWRDDELPAHRAYADVIEERLKGADAVIVLWSAESTKSQWVRAEADAARLSGTLIQASLDGTIPPLPFNQIQCADLGNWNGDAASAGWRKLTASVGALAGCGNKSKSEEAKVHPRGRSICVLPFQNMSGDAEQEYFSDGISEDITTDLSQVSALSVVARNTAFTFKGHAVNVCEVARKLAVSHVLEGSVRKAGSRVRITAQLIDGGTGDHIWAERYDRDLTDIFAIQDEISKAIVASLKIKLLPEEKKAIERRGTNNADAYNLYLMARQQWATGNHGDPRREERVIRLCLCALEIDADYADAWALLAIAQSTLRYGFGRPGDDGVEAAEKALSIDPGMAEAYCAIARRLIEQRRYGDAEAHIEAALRLNPDSWEVNKEGLRLHIRQRHFAEAAGHLERCVTLMERDYYSWGLLLTCYRALGDSKGVLRAAEMALVHAEEAIGENPDSGAALSVGARALAALGKVERAREWMEQALSVDPNNLNMSYNIGSAQAAHLDDLEAALKLILPVLEKASGTLITWAEIDPDVDVLRDDPRFQKTLADAKARLAVRSAAPVMSDLSGKRR